MFLILSILISFDAIPTNISYLFVPGLIAYSPKGNFNKPLYSLLVPVVYAFIFLVAISITVCFCLITPDGSLLLLSAITLSNKKNLSDIKPQPEPEKVYTNLHLKETRDNIRKECSQRGIYSFQCLITNDYYIGSAQNLSRRFYEHTHGFHSNIILQNAIKKYGLKNFVFSVFKAVPLNSDLLNKSELERLESEIINSFDQKTLYNLSKNHATNKGLKHSAESKLKMKELRIQRGHPLEKPVFVYNKDLKFLARFENLTQTCKQIRIDHSVLAKYLGTDKVWRNQFIFKDILLEGSIAEDIDTSLVTTAAIYKGGEKSLFVYNIEGSLVHKFSSYIEAVNKLGIPYTNINIYIKTGRPWRNKFLFTNEDKGLK